jgi:hypothetical protein
MNKQTVIESLMANYPHDEDCSIWRPISGNRTNPYCICEKQRIIDYVYNQLEEKKNEKER